MMDGGGYSCIREFVVLFVDGNEGDGFWEGEMGGDKTRAIRDPRRTEIGGYKTRAVRSSGCVHNKPHIMPLGKPQTSILNPQTSYHALGQSSTLISCPRATLNQP